MLLSKISYAPVQHSLSQPESFIVSTQYVVKNTKLHFQTTPKKRSSIKFLFLANRRDCRFYNTFNKDKTKLGHSIKAGSLGMFWTGCFMVILPATAKICEDVRKSMFHLVHVWILILCKCNGLEILWHSCSQLDTLHLKQFHLQTNVFTHTQQYLLPQTQQPRIVVLKETHTCTEYL